MVQGAREGDGESDEVGVPGRRQRGRRGGIGVFGGTFDPVHLGHLRMAEAALDALALERILFVPCSSPPHKDPALVTPAEHRFSMVKRALEEHRRTALPSASQAGVSSGGPALEVSDLELRRGGVSYTVDTLRQLRERIGDEVRLVLLLGADSLRGLPRWREAEQLLDLCEVAVIPRDEGGDEPGLRRELEQAFGASRAGRLLAATIDVEPIDISSTEIRGRAERGDSLAGLVPGSVEAYMRREGLYGYPRSP